MLKANKPFDYNRYEVLSSIGFNFVPFSDVQNTNGMKYKISLLDTIIKSSHIRSILAQTSSKLRGRNSRSMGFEDSSCANPSLRHRGHEGPDTKDAERLSFLLNTDHGRLSSKLPSFCPNATIHRRRRFRPRRSASTAARQIRSWQHPTFPGTLRFDPSRCDPIPRRLSRSSCPRYHSVFGLDLLFRFPSFRSYLLDDDHSAPSNPEIVSSNTIDNVKVGNAAIIYFYAGEWFN